MRRFFTALVLIPLAILFIAFAVANRHLVTVSFNPFDSRDTADGITLPLFAVLIVVAILGVMAGGVATWLKQGHWRRAARTHEADARQARAELADLRTQAAARIAAERPLLPAAGIGYSATGRDKTGATL